MRHLLEYCCAVCSPFLAGLIDNIIDAQRSFAKLQGGVGPPSLFVRKLRKLNQLNFKECKQTTVSILC